MAERNDDAIDHLNDLIETCKDGEKGFRAAAEAISDEGDTELRTLFNLYAQAISLQHVDFYGLGPSTLPAGHTVR